MDCSKLSDSPFSIERFACKCKRDNPDAWVEYSRRDDGKIRFSACMVEKDDDS